ncbi:MAG: hypothetical protein ACD_71C00001G0002 [uncultured bacterium (gcode 4)]|uniref:Uncharacterized protein n=1 Tax=uncultured bacterium (gcode 4) TaxID=1234023 RepID=K1Z6F5_9BACT|nr:MAG: hypothetical protein ACD_71C00001G0002 [uncultured bacterium (gcode 4)]
MRVITMKKTQKVIIQRLSEKEADNLFKIHKGKQVDRVLSTKTENRLKLAGFVTPVQYRLLFWEKPYLSSKVNFIRLSGHEIIQDKIVLLPEERKINIGKILHTYINNNNTINMMRNIPWDGKVIFDGSFSLKIKDRFGDRWIQPDGMIWKNGQIYFIETDLGSERKSVLQDKDKAYQEYFSQEVNEGNMEFKDVKVLFCTTTEKRIKKLRKEWIFLGLESLNLIKYSLNH